MISLILFKMYFFKALDFILANWREVCIFLILCLVYHYKAGRDDAVNELATYKAEQAAIVEASKKEIEIIEKVAKVQRDSAKAIHEAEVKKLNLNKDQIKRDLENEKTNIAKLLDDAYKLRVEQGNSQSRMSEVSTTTELSTTGSSHLTITLTKAGQSCALDYNVLMQSWLDACDLYGCK